MKKNKKGMTLIELLAVIAIIAILFILLIPQINSAIEKSRISGVQTDFHSYEVAVKSYLIANENQDITEENLNQHLDKALQFTSSKSKKLNPWKKPYILEISDDKKSFKITTENKDKNPKEYSLEFSIDDEGEIQMNVTGIDGSKKAASEEEKILAKEKLKTLCESRTIEETDASYFTTADVDGGISIIDYSTSGPKDVVIPCKINGKDVVDIGEISNVGAFKAKSITSIVFPNTLKTISGNYAISGNEITILTIPDSVTSISNQSFSANKITTFFIGSSLNRVSSYSFSANPDAKFYIDSNNNSYKTDEKNSGVYTKNGEKIVSGTQSSFDTETYKNIKNIFLGAFYGNNITNATIPNGVTTIDGSTFQNNQITSLTIPNSVTSIGNFAFYQNKISSLTISDNIKSIGKYAFKNNELTSVTIPNSLDTIGIEAFYTNPNLKAVINKSSISNEDLLSVFNSSPTITN